MPITQTERHYPQLPEKHADLQEHFNQLHSNVYDLRDQIQQMQTDSNKSGSAGKATFNDNIQGIKIIGTTDPQSTSGSGTTGSIKAGDTLRYNSTSGQFEFGP